MAEWEVGLGGVGICPKWVERTVKRKAKYRGAPRVVETYLRCACGKCAVCGFQLHTAVHMHADGGKPGDAPFHHRFVPTAQLHTEYPADTRIAGNGDVDGG